MHSLSRCKQVKQFYWLDPVCSHGTVSLEVPTVHGLTLHYSGTSGSAGENRISHVELGD